VNSKPTQARRGRPRLNTIDHLVDEPDPWEADLISRVSRQHETCRDEETDQ
jgi:hypothetical protein